MILEGTNASAAIRWVRQDLDEAMQSIRDDLEAFAADNAERDALKNVQESLEQLNLTFLTMEQKGLGILTDEMIAVGGHLLHDGGNVDESLSALTDAIIVLPAYLDRLQAGHEDLPILLLPTLNELRATYDETLLSEGTLFAPVLDVMVPEISNNEADAIGHAEFSAFARRIRNQYQAALLGWLREQSKPELLKPLQDVCQALHHHLSRVALRRMWWIAEMTIAGFRDGAIDNDLPLRRLFARLDLNLKALTEGGEAGPPDEALTALSRALLFHAATGRPGSKSTDLLRRRFKLEELIPDREALMRARGAVTGRDAELFRSIGDAVREEMAQVKDTLDMELRTGRVEREQREASLASLRQLADTLNMLNLPVPARAVEDLLPGLEATDGSGIDELDSPLLKLARKLIEVESILDSHIRLLGEPVEDEGGSAYIDLSSREFRQIVAQMLNECVESLHDVQDAVRKRLGGDADASFAEPLAAVAGALRLAGQPEVGGLVEKLGRTLNAGLHAKARGASDAEARLIPLTDAVAALELYLAGCRDEQANSLRFLEIMHERLDGLPEADAGGEAVDQTRIRLPERRTRAAAKPAAEPATPAGSEAPAIDPALREVFLEEFDAVMGQLADALPAWLAEPEAEKRLTDVRRGFHTLKGSGRMVGATEVGDFAWRVEELLNRVLEGKQAADADVRGAVELAVDALPDFKARLLQEPCALDAAAVAALSDFFRRMADGEPVDLAALRDVLPEFSGADPAAEPRSDAVESAPTGETAETVAEAPAAAPADDAPDRELAQLMIAEIRQYLADLDTFATGSDAQPAGMVFDGLVRSAHTLAGTLALSPLGQEVDLARALERYFEALDRHDQVASAEGQAALQSCLHRFRQRLYILEDGHATTYPLDDAALLARVEALTEAAKAPAAPADTDRDQLGESADTIDAQAPAPEARADADGLDPLTDDSGIVAIFLEEAVEVLERCDTLLNTWRDKLNDKKLVQNLQREIHTFKGGARMAGLDPLGDLSHAMESLLERIAANRLQATVAAVQALEEGCDRLNVWVEQLLTGRMPQAGDALQRFEKRAAALSVPTAKAPVSRAATSEAAIEDKVASGQGTARRPEAEAEAPTEAKAAPKVAKKPEARPEAKPEAKPEARPEARPEPRPEMRAESKPAAEPGTKPETRPAAKSKPDTKPESAPEARPEAGPARPAATVPAEPARPQAGKPKAPASAPVREFREVQDRPAAEAGDDGASQQHIRVAAELMDTLVNHAGEISIYRARLEQQLGTVRFNLKEMEQTVGRLKEQLRKMDMEAEAQMLSRYQHASAKGTTDFDPLELDRFSNMQQLSRALTESATDLLNLQEMMGESVRQAETLLVQQSRVSNDLQEGLMQTRMTPFGSAAPRLRRVVRAAAAETGKRARLQLRMAGSSDQLDRNVLERITAPLEHMLRNAVVHGIETPKERRQQGKPEEGEIVVTVESEATEFIVRVEDDGSGVNLEKVRKRAIERGLLEKDEDVTEARLTEFILESGFSTADTVTGLAGRGVGMDVVNSEIRQIGGSMDIDSESGKGTRFTIRIPFSLAVMQAIGVTVGERPYLVPLNSVSGVARMLPADYAKLIAGDSPEYEFAGERYPVLELEPLLGEEAPAKPSGNVSLLMIRAGEHKAAFRVTELQSHQEVVMKPVGPQISSIPGILGATISADGQVVIILDMGPVIRRGLALAAAAPAAKIVVPAAKEKQRKPLVMVVDDSITMRKVTSRVLENHALEVMTAQDGLDAIENLHERVPDLMLLDIEMPRMDGYELAEHVRADPRLKHVPIVMITSRAGQKHRKRARDAGANEYMTKPYQEADLVAKVGEMLKLELQPQRMD